MDYGNQGCPFGARLLSLATMGILACRLTAFFAFPSVFRRPAAISTVLTVFFVLRCGFSFSPLGHFLGY